LIDTDKYEEAKKIVEDAGLIDDNDDWDDWLEDNYRKIADLQAEVKRLQKDIEGYIAIWDYLDPKGYAWDEEEFVALIKAHGFEQEMIE